MAQAMDIGLSRRQELAATVLPAKEWSQYLNQSSDVAGFTQLLFHASCALAAASCVYWAREQGSVCALVPAELALGFVASFYFHGFHELIHDTAFRTKQINKILSQVVGFFVFRGAAWFWCFHWMHHRYTQDPAKDPELSGGSSDLLDPSKSVFSYMRFLTGWPFGFERVWGMAKMAAGVRVDDWVKEADMEVPVRREAAVYVACYLALACACVWSQSAQEVVVWYWLLPHMIGAGHLRFYQFAEHRACETGVATDLDAWGTSRTTATWFLYRRLAWNMPFHVEHHAWPAVPFHLLPSVHERIKENQPASGCVISGKSGYFAIHLDFIGRVWRGDPVRPQQRAPASPSSDPEEPTSPVQKRDIGEIAAERGRFTMEEVSKHDSKESCWVVLDGVVIDVTTFLPNHPGGEENLVKKAGKDATKVFRMIHPAGTLERHLPDACIIGVLAAEKTSGGLKEPLLGA